MGKRVGFGAALASAVVFSVLLISNFAILIGSSQREKLTAESDAESYLYDRAQVMAGAEGLTLLGRVQTLVSSRVFPCPGLPAAVASYIGVIQTSQTAGTLTVNASLSSGPDSARSEDQGVFLPYNGSVTGNLDVVLKVSAETSAPLYGVVMHESEMDRLNLPARLDAVESFCEESIRSIASYLILATAGGCNSTEIIASANAESQSVEQAAEAEGLTVHVRYSVVDGPQCKVDFVIEVSQRGIVGPDGPFTIGAVGGGSVLLENLG